MKPQSGERDRPRSPSQGWSPAVTRIGSLLVNVAQTLLPRTVQAQSAVSDAACPQAGPGRIYGWRMSLAVFAAATIPGLAFANCVLNHFYLQGAYFWDSGVVAGAIWRRDVWLTYAPLWPIGSLYAYHVMPLLSALTVASRVVPINLPGWFALAIGVGHALPSVAVFWLLTEGLRLRSKVGVVAAITLAVLTAFSGIPLATIRFPHPEILLAGGLTLVFAAIALERYWVAAACLAVALLVREDAGFHAFGLMLLLCMANRVRGRSWREQRPLVILASISFLYSVAAVAFKHVAFPNQPSLFAADYIGSPPFSHTSILTVLLNFIGLMIYRGYVVWPAAAAAVWAVRSRNVLIVLGYCAFCPWLLLNLMANRQIPSTLSGYYSFPFLVALVWPLAAVTIEARQRQGRPDVRSTLGWFCIMLMLSFLGLSSQWNPGHMDLWKNFTTLPSLRRQTATYGAVKVLLAAEAAAAGSRFGTIGMDQSVYSLAPYSFDASAVITVYPATTLLPVERTSPARSRPIDTVAYFKEGYDIDRIRQRIALNKLTHQYRFKDTSIWLASNRNLDGVIGVERVPPDDALQR